MRLNTITISCLGLGLYGCASTPVPTSTQMSLDTPQQRAAYAMSGLFTQRNYAFDATLQFSTDFTGKTTNKDNTPITWQDVAQELNLSPDQRQNARTQLLKKVQRHTGLTPPVQIQQQLEQGLKEKTQKEAGIAQKVETSIQNPESKLNAFLKRNQLYMSGVVDLQNRRIATDYGFKYQGTNAYYNINFPLALDLRRAKFYADLSALSPLVTDPKYDGRYTVFDFAKLAKKFKKESKIDLKKAFNLYKDMTLISVLLTDPKDLTQVELTDEDKKLGGVERIRFPTKYREAAYQTHLFLLVNRPYLNKSFGEENATKLINTLNGSWSSTEKEVEDDETETAVANAAAAAADAADAANAAAADSEHPTAAATATEAATEAAASFEGVDRINSNFTESPQADELSSFIQQHFPKFSPDPHNTAAIEELAAEAASAEQETDVDDSHEQQDNDHEVQTAAELSETDQFFANLQSENYITPQAFQTLIEANYEQYKKGLENYEIDSKSAVFYDNLTMIGDYVLDAQGRLVRNYIDMSFNLSNLRAEAPTLKMNGILNLSQYGAATIDTRALRRAIPFKQNANENTLWGNIFNKKLVALDELSSDSTKPATEAEIIARAEAAASYAAMPNDTTTPVLKRYIQSVYRETNSVIKAFSALYTYNYLKDEYDPESTLSAEELQHIANVWAAFYAENYFEKVLTPQEKRLSQQRDKIITRTGSSYDIGSNTYTQLSAWIQELDNQDQLNGIKQQYSEQHIFSQLYAAAMIGFGPVMNTHQHAEQVQEAATAAAAVVIYGVGNEYMAKHAISNALDDLAAGNKPSILTAQKASKHSEYNQGTLASYSLEEQKNILQTADILAEIAVQQHKKQPVSTSSIRQMNENQLKWVHLRLYQTIYNLLYPQL